MAPDHKIQVYALFPRVVALGPDLNVDPSNWHWIHCLTLPLETLNALQFSPRPYKWIRYAIGVVVGAEGDLSSSSESPSPELPNVVDYNAGIPAESAVLYYHISDEEKRRMFPIDPDIGHTNITSSVTTTRRAQFRDDVAERDGRTCVLASINQQHCNAIHLLAHSKGDTYIATYTQHRSRDPTGGDIVQDIDSVRNGLFLNDFTHSGLGADVAFLMTPNFSMTTADIDPTAPPTERRYTAHLFQLDDPFLLGRETLSSGSPLRISDTPEWPPAILFDAVYAGAIIHHFRTQALVDEFTASWKDSYYPGGAMTAAGTDSKTLTDEQAAVTGRAENQAQARQARFDARQARIEARRARIGAHDGPDAFDMLLGLPYILVPPNERQAMLREAKEKAEVKEQRRVQEKVDTWMNQVTNA